MLLDGILADAHRIQALHVGYALEIEDALDHFVGIWWSGSDDDARPAGQDAKGYLALNLNGLGASYPAIQDIMKYVVDKGKSQVDSKDRVASYCERVVRIG